MRCDVWSAQWEGPLGQWLRGQLDARGIDAPAYGRYVLSLLTRPLQPADLSPDTIQGGKTWERRNKSKWGPVKIEALKRAAAVQCLTNASEEQGSGIEQLVDELCKKIKEVEETGGNRRDRANQATRARRERRRTLSPREMARLYYAAFPALQQPDPACKENIPVPGRTWAGRRVAPPLLAAPPRAVAPAPPRARRAPRQRLPQWVTHGDTWDMDAHDPLRDLGRDEGYGTCDTTLAEDSAGSKRLYERDSDSSPRCESDDAILCEDWVITEDFCPLPKSRDEEEIIAKFEAKFDRSLEALWPKRQNETPEDDYREIPVDFQDLLSSPSDRMFDCPSSPERPLPASLTGSIWSNNDASFECEMGDCAFRKEDRRPSAFLSDSTFNFYPKIQSNLWQRETDSYSKESMELIYNKLRPLNLDDADDECHPIEFSAWGPAEESQLWGSTSSLDPLPCYAAVPAATTAIRSLTTLNHNPLYSSFTEVIPKSTAGYIGDTIKRKSNTQFNVDFSETVNVGLPETVTIGPNGEKIEEDYLTSMRTHFKPIKKESVGNTHAIVDYPDGVTFPIISDLDEVRFNRSSSGSIFLESDIDPPKMYMEFRKQGIDYARLEIHPSATCSDEGLSCRDLVPKFKVCQTEKSVQTEVSAQEISDADDDNNEIEPLPECAAESAPEVVVSPEVSPGPEEKFGKAADADRELESSQSNWIQCEECESNGAPWVTDHSRPPLLGYNSAEIWGSDGKRCGDCARLQAAERARRRGSAQAARYEAEAARDWEQLLSDISSAGAAEPTVRAADGDYVRAARGLLARKRRHSAGGAGGAGKLRCPAPPRPPALPLLLAAAADRPLTR